MKNSYNRRSVIEHENLQKKCLRTIPAFTDTLFTFRHICSRSIYAWWSLTTAGSMHHNDVMDEHVSVETLAGNLAMKFDICIKGNFRVAGKTFYNGSYCQKRACFVSFSTSNVEFCYT